MKPDTEFEIITPSSCGVCKGVLTPRPIDADACACYPPLYWSGSECVPRTQCPCVEGHMAYEIGENYQTENCSDCICKIGGIPECKQKICAPCGSGLRRESPLSCSCKCVKCPPETILCLTSGECIDESSWCDGIQDCPDDEKNCLITQQPTIHINRTETTSKILYSIAWRSFVTMLIPLSYHKEMSRSKLPARILSKGKESKKSEDDVKILRQVCKDFLARKN